MSGGTRWNGCRRALRVVGWNVALLAAGLVVIAAAGEIYLRATVPFTGGYRPMRFVPDVGYVGAPDGEIRHTNHIDFWTVTRTNRLGFADREPISPARAAAGCHVATIGDSFVEAIQVPIAQKFHVWLEALARRELPHLDVTTSAYGESGFAPVNQLPLYDKYARQLHPRVLVLVFTLNDLWENSSVLRGMISGWDADSLPFVTVRRESDGTFTLLPPDAGPVKRRNRFRGLAATLQSSYFVTWLRGHLNRRWPQLEAAVNDALQRSPRPRFSGIPLQWQWSRAFRAPSLAPEFEEALALAGFALDQFVERTRRDGVALVILAAYNLGGRDDPAFGRLRALTEARDIPVVNQYDYIVGRGGNVEDAHWPHDGHWSPAGHQWAAEALLEYLRRNPEICRPRG